MNADRCLLPHARRFLTPALALAFACAPAGVARAPSVSAGSLARADSILADAAAREEIPGAVLVVTQHGRIVHERAFGHAQLYDYGMKRLAAPRAMQTSTVFDLASVTKVMATTYAIMLLVDRGMVDVDAPAHRYLPELRGTPLEPIT